MAIRGSIRGLDKGATIPAQDIYEQSETQKHKIGTRLQIGDRVFRYASAGAAIDRAQLCESAAVRGAVTTDQKDLAVAAVAVGDTTITATTLTTAQTINRFAEGWLAIVSDTIAHGCGQTFKIKSHPAQAAAGALVFTLYDEVPVAITTDCKASLTANLWARVKETAVTTAVGVPVGAFLVSMTSGYYGWCQTWGEIGLLTGSTTTIDSQMIRGLEAGETDIEATAGITPAIGFYCEIGADGDYPLCYLQIAP